MGIPRWKKKKTSQRQETFLVSRSPGFEKFWQDMEAFCQNYQENKEISEEGKIWRLYLPRLARGEEIECGLEKAALIISASYFSLFDTSESQIVSRDSSGVTYTLPFQTWTRYERDNEKLDREVQKRMKRIMRLALERTEFEEKEEV